MRKNSLTFAAFAAATACALALGACTVTKPSSQYINAVVQDGYVVVQKADITGDALYVNYDADGVTVQVIGVSATDGSPRVALDTCQSCNPSPKAYFQQDGATLQCQNCGLEFSVDTVGAVGASSCNPTPIAGVQETEDAFLIPVESLDAYRPNFEQWRGKTA